MYVRRNISFRVIFAFGWLRVSIFTVIGFIAVWLYLYMDCFFVAIPFLPVSLVGTATAFYIGFKNNASYDRLWEARRLWGGIVNDSRLWAFCCRDYITNLFANEELGKDELQSWNKKLIYTHIAYLNALRMQLRKSQTWEHNAQWNENFRERLNSKYDIKALETDIRKLCGDEVCSRVIHHSNIASSLLSEQSKTLEELRRKGLIDDFRHIELQKIIQNFLNHQGGCERIKNFPFPRQYAVFSNIFVWLFVIILPFSLLESFGEISRTFTWMVIPFSVLVSWLLMTMELVGDYSENPFENLINDVPINAMSRNIEIELREFLGEKDLPPKVLPIDDILL
jgi:ion channel-forming bestrophin family protein